MSDGDRGTGEDNNVTKSKLVNITSTLADSDDEVVDLSSGPTIKPKRQKRNKPKITREVKSKKFSNSVIRMSSIMAILMVASMVYFFTSDIPDKILAQKIAWANITDGSNLVDGSYDYDDDSFHSNDDVENGDFTISSIPGIITHVNSQEILEYLEVAEDDVYVAFLRSLHKASKSKELGSLIASDEFQARINGELLDVIEDSISNGKTLEEAYREAERLYPGQISADKRLSLIDELNAKDYMYYVAERGDTLLDLSRIFKVPLGQLIAINGIHDADKIPAGMIILFPLDTLPVDIINQANNN